MSYSSVQLGLPALHSLESSSSPATTKGSLHLVARLCIVCCEPLLDGIATIGSIQLAWIVAKLAHGGAEAYARPSFVTSFAIALYAMVLLERAGAYKPAKSMLFVRETAILMAVSCSYAMTLAVASYARVAFCPVLEAPLNGCLMFLFLLTAKTLVHSYAQKLHERGVTATRIALCGSSPACGRLFSTLVNSPKLGMWPVVIVDPCNTGDGGELFENGYQLTKSARIVHGELSCDQLTSAGVEKILVVASSFSEAQLAAVLQYTSHCSIPTEICAGDLASSNVPVEWADIDGIMIWRPMRGDKLGLYAGAKWLFDSIVAACLLVLLGPVIVCVALAIKVTSPGTVLFRQERVGKNGRLFTMFKFRTMHQAACGSQFSPKSGHDPRISKIGRLLRKTSLDELPQLFNVLRGEMSLVGPRPEMPFIVKDYTPIQQRRLEVLPGITGLWQISAHRRDLIHNNMQYDLYYVRHRNCFLDMAILVHTLLFAMRGV